jgi:hypothetical protein
MRDEIVSLCRLVTAVACRCVVVCPCVPSAGEWCEVCWCRLQWCYRASVLLCAKPSVVLLDKCWRLGVLVFWTSAEVPCVDNGELESSIAHPLF